MTDLVRLDDVFEIVYGNKFDLVKMCQVPDGVAFVSRKGKDQGVSASVEPVPGVDPYPAGSLTVALGGSRLLSTFVQAQPFYTAQNVAVLRPRDDAMTLEARLFYAACVWENRHRYTAFGREANRTLRALLVPASPPTWVGSVTVNGMLDDFSSPADAGPVLLPAVSEWCDFRFDDLFDIVKGERIVVKNQEPGATAYVGASRENNGVTDRLDITPKHPAGTITVSYNGTVGYAAVQPEPFHASDDINVCYPRDVITPLAKMFLCGLIRTEAQRFSYGRKWNLERMRASTLRLPVTAAGTPNWDLIDDYMKTMRYSGQVPHNLAV